MKANQLTGVHCLGCDKDVLPHELARPPWPSICDECAPRLAQQGGAPGRRTPAEAARGREAERAAERAPPAVG